MGWAGATDLFDSAVKVTLMFVPKIPSALSENEYDTPEAVVRAVVETMYTKVDWEDWDTQDESDFFEKYLIHVMHDRGEIDEEYYTWYTEDR